MACEFSPVLRCGCPVGWNIPLKDSEGENITAYPVIVLDVNGDELGVANSPSEYVDLWNSAAVNNAVGKLFVGVGAYCFYIKTTSSPDDEFVLGGSPANDVLATEDNEPLEHEENTNQIEP